MFAGAGLKYDSTASSRPQHNGNIAKVIVKTAAVAGVTFKTLAYDYRYDKLNRLTDAVSTDSLLKDGLHSEYLTYDNMGNITNLGRYDKVPGTGRRQIDSLTYFNSGNRPQRIDDASSYTGTWGFTDGTQVNAEYKYDGNGNQITDKNKGSYVYGYNMLNLPQTITKGTGASVIYVYDAGGRKLRKIYANGGSTMTTEYVNGIEYDSGTSTITFVQTEEGRARKNGALYKYEYDLKDHLGNTRLTTTWDGNDATQLTPSNQQHTDYYAFGYTIQSSQTYIASPQNHYLYNGKELQDETGLYDYGARLYDPVIGRWNSVDRFAEKYLQYSPYQYGLLNPVRNIDMNGDSVRFGIMQMYDAQKNTNAAQDTKSDLAFESGLSLSFNETGQLDYAKDPYDGQPIIDYEDDGNGGLREAGSATARAELINAINDPTTVDVRPSVGQNTNTPLGSKEIKLNIDQIKSFMSGAQNLDSRTQGFGMTFLHEYFHTVNGGSLSDVGRVGAVESKMNTIRSELNTKGANFGQRTSYEGTTFSQGKAYLPFDSNSFNSLQNGVVPANTDKFIIYKP